MCRIPKKRSGHKIRPYGAWGKLNVMYLAAINGLSYFYTAFLRVTLWVLLDGAAAEFVYHSAAIDR